jgi:hypothetical protein
MNAALWTAQILLTVIFLFTGALKLTTPIAELTKQMPGTAWFVRPLGVAEVLGAIGVTLPWLLGIWPALTPLAAAGLVIIMIGATVYSVRLGAGVLVLIPVVVGMLAAFVAYGRRRVVPRRHPG